MVSVGADQVEPELRPAALCHSGKSLAKARKMAKFLDACRLSRQTLHTNAEALASNGLAHWQVWLTVVAGPISTLHMTRHCRSRLSQRALTSLQTGQWCSESLGYGRGSLQVRATPAGVLYYYRSGGERTRIPLGPGSGPRALSLDEARQESLALAAHNQSAKPGDDSLGALLICYAKRLEQRGAATAQATMALFRRHIERPHPDIWLRQARRIQPEHATYSDGSYVRSCGLRPAAGSCRPCGP